MSSPESPPVSESSEEGRAYLQQRVALFWKVMFFLCLLGVFMGASGALAKPGLDVVITVALAVEAGAAWWLLACLEKDPALRPESAAALRQQIEACHVEPWSAEDARGGWLEHQSALEPSEAPSTSGPKTIAVRGLRQTAS